jgi:hypothetical protein
LDSRGKWVFGFHLKRKCVAELLFSGTPSTTQGGFLLSVWFQLFLPSFLLLPSCYRFEIRKLSVCKSLPRDSQNLPPKHKTPIDPEAERK